MKELCATGADAESVRENAPRSWEKPFKPVGTPFSILGVRNESAS
jgi:hypothetical protein